MFKFLMAGESHGLGLMGIIEGFPSGIKIEKENIDKELKKRQQGYGRGDRQKIESDSVKIISGIRGGVTLGSPIGIYVENRDYENWKDIMDPFEIDEKKTIEKNVERPRPGHGDLNGYFKYNHKDMRNVLERASARETAIRVAGGGLFKEFLRLFKVDICSHVVSAGEVSFEEVVSFDEIKREAELSVVKVVNKEFEKKVIEKINEIKEEKDTLGGSFEIRVKGLIPGIGSHVHFDRKLDGLLAGELMSLQGIKAVEIGRGKKAGVLKGSLIQDEIFFDKTKGVYRETNNCGGIEAGMSNGEELVIRCTMKPIPTVGKLLRSIDISDLSKSDSAFERSDVFAVPSASVVGESIVAHVLANCYSEKFGGDFLEEVLNSYNYYLKTLEEKGWKVNQ